METINELTDQIKQHFKSHGVDLFPANAGRTQTFCLLQFSEFIEESIGNSATLLCNLEDAEAMEEIARGEYEEFDMWNESMFNDCYWDMMSDIGYGNDDEDEKEIEC